MKRLLYFPATSQGGQGAPARRTYGPAARGEHHKPLAEDPQALDNLLMVIGVALGLAVYFVIF